MILQNSHDTADSANPNGFSENTTRSIRENSDQLGLNLEIN